MIHMTDTGLRASGEFTVTCRCGWHREGFASRTQARNAGDEHLAEANKQ